MDRLEPREEAVAVAHVEEVVELGELAEECRAVLDRHAAGHGHGTPGARPLPLDEVAEFAVDLLLRVLPHRAGDQHGEIRIVQRDVGDAADLREAFGKHLVVGVVHLAADVPEMDARRPSEHGDDRLPAGGALGKRDRLEAAS